MSACEMCHGRRWVFVEEWGVRKADCPMCLGVLLAESGEQLAAATARAERAEAQRDSLADQLMREEVDNARNGEARERAEAAEADLRAVVTSAERYLRRTHVRGQDNLAEKLGLAAPDLCLADGETWPCPTIAALDAQRPAEEES